MKPELEQIYAETLENEPRSKLDPYCEPILRWRRQGKSYRAIVKLLADKCNLKVAKTPLMRFVKRRSRPRKSQPELEPLEATPAVTNQNEFTFKRAEGVTDPYAEVRARMARDKAQPVQPKPAKAFEYTDEDSIKPIVLLQPKKEN
jgi:hypothetical protein